MKRKIALLLAAIMVLSIFAAGCGKKDDDASGESHGGKTKLTFYGKVIEHKSGPAMCDKMKEIMGDDYEIEALQVDWANLDKVIRTGLATSEPCDVYNYFHFANVIYKDQAMDLTPYLDENDGEWRKQLDDSLLEMCTDKDGKVLSVPWGANFTALLINKEAFEKAGVEIPEEWDFPTFLAACQKLKDAGYYPFATPMDLAQAGWLPRHAILSTALGADKYEDYCNGQMEFTGPETRRALEAIKSIYDNDYAYPGEGAVIAKKDEIQAAFLQGKVAMIANVADQAKEIVDAAEFECVAGPWPYVDVPAITAAATTFFVPKNSRHPEDAVKMIKAFTSEEVQSIHSDLGYLPSNKNVKPSDPFVSSLIAQMATAYGGEYNSTAYMDYLNNNLMPDLILNGGVDVVMENLEAIRQEDLANAE